MPPACRILLFFILTGRVFSQDPWYHYNWDATNRNDFGNLYKYVYNLDLKKYRDNIYIGQYYERFARECAAYVNGDVAYGNFYKSIEGYEDYLKKIVTTIIKDTSITNHIKIFFQRDHDFNASMNESGIICVNVGAVARTNNEAELAMTLGHEAAHFVNEDVIKGFGRLIEMENQAINVVSFGWGFINVGSNSYANHMWYSREQEAAADFASIKYLRASPYSLKSCANLFRILKRLEVREELKHGKGSDVYSSHPDPGDRLKQVKFLSVDSLNKGKKNFVVDSVSFMKIKELCYQETVNICLEDDHIEDLIDLTFGRYLLEPDNQNNLAALIEGIRRMLVYYKDKKIEDEPFIFYKYSAKEIKRSDNYGYLNKKNVSILNYLTRGFLDLGREDISRVKATDLLDTTVTEFSTYGEAYAYFKQKARDLGCRVCEHYKYFGKEADFSDVDDYISKNTLFETTELLKAKGAIMPGEKNMVVMLHSDLTKISEILNRKTIEDEAELYDQLVKGLELEFGSNVYKQYELPYKDQHQLWGLLNLCFDKLSPLSPNKVIKNKNEVWTDVAPELYGFFRRNNVKNLYVCKAGLYQSADKKSYSTFHYYKISLPAEKGFTYAGEIKRGDTQLSTDYREYIRSLASQFMFFYNSTK